MLINYKEIVIKNILGSDCPSKWGLEDGMSEQECERGNSCYECWYRSLALNRDGYRREYYD